ALVLIENGVSAVPFTSGTRQRQPPNGKIDVKLTIRDLAHGSGLWRLLCSRQGKGSKGCWDTGNWYEPERLIQSATPFRIASGLSYRIGGLACGMETRHFDYVVIGGGSAGYAAARTAREELGNVAIIDDAAELSGLCILR